MDGVDMSKELVFSVTAKDCEWSYARGSGKGGQKRNKTSSAVRCVHTESGAVGQSDDTRSQHRNKRIAFRRMAQTKEFTVWHKIEVSRRLGRYKQVEERVNELMHPRFIREETYCPD